MLLYANSARGKGCSNGTAGSQHSTGDTVQGWHWFVLSVHQSVVNRLLRGSAGS